jgi:hypothetical protein
MPDREGARALHDGTRVLEDVLDARADFVGVHQHDFVDVLAAQAERFLAHLPDRDAVREDADPLEHHALLGAHRIVHGGRVHRFDADDPDLRVQEFRVDRDAGDEAAAAHGHEDRVDVAARLAQDFHRDGALPRDDVRVIEGMHEREVALAHDGLSVFVCAVVIVAVQHHLAAEISHGAHLDGRGGQRHHDGGGDAAALRGQCHALRMIAGRGADDTALRHRVGQVRNLVVGAAQLEREHRLQVLALEHHGVADAARQARRRLQWGLHRHVVDAGLENALDVVVGHGGPAY